MFIKGRKTCRNELNVSQLQQLLLSLLILNVILEMIIFSFMNNIYNFTTFLKLNIAKIIL